MGRITSMGRKAGVCKKAISLVLAVALIITMIPVGETGSIKADTSEGVLASTLDTGDTFTMGYWPQSEVTDEDTLEALNSLSVTMINYGYTYDYSYSTLDMCYGDVTYNGSKYRKIYFTQYRPYRTYYSSFASNSFQYYNGYYAETVYWFKWEPVEWQVLDKESDGLYCVSTMVLDSQAYDNILEDNVTWETSTIRQWLNETFYESAFTSNEKKKIKSVTHENEDNPHYGTEGGNDTTDKIWLLSYSDAISSNYGFSSINYECDTARQTKGTDYAKSQGLYVESSGSYLGNSWWWLRTPGCVSSYASDVDAEGVAYYVDAGYVDYASNGVRPAFKINLSSTISSSESPTTDEEDTTTKDTTTDQTTTTSEFEILRDGNSFYHNNKLESQGFYGVSNYSIPDSDYRNQLFNLSSKSEKKELLTKMYMNRWNGSCHGIAATMGLAYMGNLPVVNNTGNSYHDMPLPYTNTEFLSAIQYYQLTQYVNNYSDYGKAYWNPSVYKSKSNDITISEFFANFVQTLKSGKILQLDYGYSVGGHSILALDVSDYDSGYQVKLYDENSYNDGNAYFTYMYISSDFSKFSIEEYDVITGIGNQSLDSHFENYNYEKYERFTFLKYYDLDDYVKVENGEYEDVDSSLSKFMKLLVTDDSTFTITNESGDELVYDGEEFSGDIGIEKINPIVYGDETEYEITINETEDISLSTEDENTDISISNDIYYVNVTGQNITDIDVDFNEENSSVSLAGDGDYTYQISVSSAEDEDIKVISGSAGEQIVLNENDSHIIVTSATDMSDISVSNVTDSGVNNLRTYDSGNNLVIDEENNVYVDVEEETKTGETETTIVTAETEEYETTTGSKDETTTENKNEASKSDVVDSTWETIERPDKIKSLKVKAITKKKVKLIWKKTSGASGYQIMCATNKKFTKNKQTKQVKKAKTTSKAIKKLKSGKKYFFKVRAYTLTNGKKTYGKWSKVKTVKTRK